MTNIPALTAQPPLVGCGRYLGYSRGRRSYCGGGHLCVTCRKAIEAWAAAQRDGQ